MSVKGMMQTVLVTELKQVQPDISNEALQYVVDNFSQVFDVREILAEENQELFQYNKNLNTALQRVSDYNLRLEESNKSFVSALQKAEAYNVQLEKAAIAIRARGNILYRLTVQLMNGSELCDSDWDYISESQVLEIQQCLTEIKAEAVLQFAGTVLVKYRYDITEWAKEYADKVRQGEL